MPKACPWALILTPLLCHDGDPVLPAPRHPSLLPVWSSPTGAAQCVKISLPSATLTASWAAAQINFLDISKLGEWLLSFCLPPAEVSPPMAAAPNPGWGLWGKGLQGKEAWSLAEICAVPSLQP